MTLEVVGTSSSDKIKIYDAAGKRAGEIDKSQAVTRRAVDCNEEYGIIKIVLADNREVWIDRSEAKRVGDADDAVASNKKPCVTQERSNDPTNSHLASNGVQSENCSVNR